ncbi:hypothetical protein BBJ28_00019177 [Nothophytophthora sp. Chile5]|nr:hypothetical protein BBJ28_00019177 [Nothophytophthora sp. Chile5]
MLQRTEHQSVVDQALHIVRVLYELHPRSPDPPLATTSPGFLSFGNPLTQNDFLSDAPTPFNETAAYRSLLGPRTSPSDESLHRLVGLHVKSPALEAPLALTSKRILLMLAKRLETSPPPPQFVDSRQSQQTVVENLHLVPPSLPSQESVRRKRDMLMVEQQPDEIRSPLVVVDLSAPGQPDAFQQTALLGLRSLDEILSTLFAIHFPAKEAGLETRPLPRQELDRRNALRTLLSLLSHRLLRLLQLTTVPDLETPSLPSL